ncbi:hypothetical protein H6501_00700 [Candidatus Woesearchaeota archaeon]|nr:hypothetical protein [Candidatus Woesearchaeota archaeon]USN44627.1 MAG: hypothetical protein H6500_02175 [Candidatus Woesearchaeota archaeon]
MTDEQVTKFEEKLSKLEWVPMLFLHLFLTLVLSISSYVTLYNLVPTEKSLNILLTFLILLIPNIILGILFLFGGYYFTKLFFKTTLSVTEFYTVLIYLYLPLLTAYAGISLLAMALSFVSTTYASLAYLLFLPMIYYGLKEINTSLYLFKREFNTGNWQLIGVVMLWAFITNVITEIITFGLNLLLLGIN